MPQTIKCLRSGGGVGGEQMTLRTFFYIPETTLYVFFGEMPVQVLCFFKERIVRGFVFCLFVSFCFVSLLSCKSSLHILDIN